MPKVKVKTKEIPSPHHYFYPGTDTLKNKYRIKDPKVLSIKCSREIEKAMVNLRQELPPKQLDSSYLKYIHLCLFEDIFEWAGQTRDESFTFADGSSATRPKTKKKGQAIPFETGDKIQEGLKKLDQVLIEKNNLQYLTREEFINEALKIFISLRHIHPFIKGNRCTRQIFLEKLGQVAGHHLDFSLVTKEHMDLVSIKAEEGDLEPLRNLFELISNPQRISKELLSPTKTQQKGHVSPEQRKTLKDYDKTAFAVRTTKEPENVLIPGKKLVPLAKNELFEIMSENPGILVGRQQILRFAKHVYRNPKILDEKIPQMIKEPDLCETLADQIEKFPRSVSRLAGIKIFRWKSAARKRAEEHVSLLSFAIRNYKSIIEQAQKTLLQEHQATKNKDYLKHSQSINISESKAKVMTDIVQKTKQALQQSQ
ncbi:BID domain-containing T4SS effector [Bartonella taylorii]|uniref:BID domain-containing T4SS effector n=1 Tax=Bartonella taylorii TaxID=33046 RepID=UPI001ABB7557|nr:BID domain-containing T4SS effector [Bartonella taylorii]